MCDEFRNSYNNELQIITTAYRRTPNYGVNNGRTNVHVTLHFQTVLCIPCKFSNCMKAGLGISTGHWRMFGKNLSYVQ